MSERSPEKDTPQPCPCGADGDGFGGCSTCLGAGELYVACPTCGPTAPEFHPRRPGVTRCSNCKEWLRVSSPEVTE